MRKENFVYWDCQPLNIIQSNVAKLLSCQTVRFALCVLL